MSTRVAIDINNKKLLFTDVIYLSPDGDDNGNGTYNNPYKTLSKAINIVKNDTTAIVLKKGEYNQSLYTITHGNRPSSVAYYRHDVGYYDYNNYYCQQDNKKTLITSYNYTINIIGEDNKVSISTIFNSAMNSIISPGLTKPIYVYGIKFLVDCQYAFTADSNVFMSATADCKSAYIYNCIFKYVKNYNQKRGIFGTSLPAQAFYLYNCLIDLGDVNNAYSGYRGAYVRDTGYRDYGVKINGDNSLLQQINSKLIAVNTIFKNINTWSDLNEYQYGAFIELQNCIFPNCSNYGNLVYDNTSYKSDVGLDDDSYPMLSNLWINTGRKDIRNNDTKISHIGLYGGPYAWTKIITEDGNIELTTFYNFINKNSNEDIEFKIIPPKSSDIQKNNSIESGNFISSDRIRYIYPIDQRTWGKTNRLEFI